MFTRRFVEIQEAAGVKSIKLPARSPNLNRYAERFVRTIRTERLDHLVVFGERHLRVLLREFCAHYHGERNHQGLGNRLIEPLVANTNSGKDVIRRRERLGGVLNYYYLEAA